MGTNSSSSHQARERLAAVTVHAVKTVTDLMRAAGPGQHRITTAVQPENADPVVAHAWFEVVGEGEDALWSGGMAATAEVAKAVQLAFVLAKGSLILGTTSPTGEESVRAWMIDGHALRPLTADQVRRAFHETVGPDSAAVSYQTAFAVPESSAA